ncbi:MAG: methionine--tRNA ligase [Opitutales bacterium]
MQKRFYVTTAIDYANGSPHLGHAYEKVLADVVTRARRLRGEDTHFLTGLDEHGQKVQQGAAREGVEPQARCDRIAEEFQDLCEKLLISNDDYLRTTEERHKKVVSEVLQRLFDEDQIYQAEYVGFYSARAEQFLLEKDKVEGEWPEIYGEVVEITESNYFFKLSQHQDWLIEHLRTNEDFIFPQFRCNQVLEFLKEPLNDLCISRPVERLSWGIPLPFDDNYVTYVWFDALLNYVSAVGYGKDRFSEYWPADVHVIGKDILSPPHAVYWPIMLKALGMKLPMQILVHGWWAKGGKKMSKSTGEVVDPLALAEQHGPDAFRYFVMREMTVGQDSEFTSELFLTRYNSDLGNDLGNLVSRILDMTSRYAEGLVPAATVDEEPEQDLRRTWEKTRDPVLETYDGYQYNFGLEKTFAFVRAINRYVEVRAPWKLAKSEDPDDAPRLATSLAVMAEALRLATSLLAPVMPGINAKINELLGLGPTESWEGALDWGTTLEGNQLGEKAILFPRA